MPHSYHASIMPLWRQLVQILNSRSISLLVYICFAATCLPLESLAQESGWGCKMGADGQWNCSWSGEDDPPESETKAQTPLPVPKTENQTAADRAPLEMPKSSAEDKSEADAPQDPSGQQPKQTTNKSASTISKLKNWFGFSNDDDKQEVVQKTGKKGDVTPSAGNGVSDDPGDSSGRQVDQQVALPKPDVEDIEVTDAKSALPEDTGAVHVKKNAKPSTMDRVKRWFGLSGDKPVGSVARGDEKEAVSSSSTAQVEQTTPVAVEQQEQELNATAKAPSVRDKPTMAKKIKSWFGWSKKKASDSVISSDVKKDTSRPVSNKEETARAGSSGQASTSPYKRTAPEVPVKEEPPNAKYRMQPPSGNSVSAKAVGKSGNESSLPSSIVQPIPENGDAQVEKKLSPNKKTTWLNRVGHWLGLSKEEKEKKKPAPGKPGGVMIMPDISVKDVPAQ